MLLVGRLLGGLSSVEADKARFFPAMVSKDTDSAQPGVCGMGR